MQISCFHTADVHIATFQALFAEMAPGADVRHVVREDLLARAQSEGIASIHDETIQALGELGTADAVLCSCSTLGTLVDDLNDPRFIRVDRPMMDAACKIGPGVLMAICLESTREPSLALLEQSAADLGLPLYASVHLCEGAWPHFVANDSAAFAHTVAASIRRTVRNHDCIVLAQASMQVAAPLLTNLKIPILTSPALAAQAAIAQAQA